MRTNAMTGIAGALIALAIGTSSVWAQQAAPPVPLTEAGQKLEARYAEQLNQLRTELSARIPQRELVKAVAKAEGKSDGVEKLLATDKLDPKATKPDALNQVRPDKPEKVGQDDQPKSEVKADVLEKFLASDALDAKFAKFVVLHETTPRGLAEFAQQGAERAALVEKLLADANLMKEMLLADGANAPRVERGFGPAQYGPAMKIYADIQKAVRSESRQDFRPSARTAETRAETLGGAEQWAVFETSFTSSKKYENPFVEVEVDVVFRQGDKQWKVPAFWAGDHTWTVRFAPQLQGQYTYCVECTDKANLGLNGNERSLSVVAYQGNNPLLKHGPLRISANKRHFEHADGTPFFWLGDTWWKGLCKRLPWDGFQELTADRKRKGFSVVQIVCGTYPDEPGLLKPSWANEGGMPYLKQDFSAVNPEYFKYADRRLHHLVEAGIVPAIVSGWGRAVNLNTVGLPGYKRHFRNLIARYGAYPVIWILGGETDKGQGPWHELAQYDVATDPYDRLLCNHSSHLRHALEGSAMFDFDMDATGHNSWSTVNHVLANVRKSLKEAPLKPFVSGESCYELHMQENPAYLQRYQFWALMLAGAAGHTYGAAGIWHMATPEEHGNWGGWGGQPYDLTTWNEGMNFPGSAQLGRGKALLEQLPWQQFEEHPEWVGKNVFAAGIPGKIRVIYQPSRGVYNWDGITLNQIETGSWTAFYFDPVSGRRYDLGLHMLSGTWKSPNVPSPQDWVLVMQLQNPTKRVTLARAKAGEQCSGKLEPSGATFTTQNGPKWLTIHADGSYSGIPQKSNAGPNSFLLAVRKPGDEEKLVELNVNVLGADGEVFVETFGGYTGTQNNKQTDTALNVAYQGKVAGWTHSGSGAIHALDRAFQGGQVTPSDWAIMIFADNVITSAEMDANTAGVSYRVAFETSPAVYAERSQATKAEDGLLVEVLHHDGTVLKKFEHAPGAWNGKSEFRAAHFDYSGEGSGLVRLRIGPAGNKNDQRFNGAIDNIVVRETK